MRNDSQPGSIASVVAILKCLINLLSKVSTQTYTNNRPTEEINRSSISLFGYATDEVYNFARWLHYSDVQLHSLTSRSQIHRKGWQKIYFWKAIGIPDFQQSIVFILILKMSLSQRRNVVGSSCMLNKGLFPPAYCGCSRPIGLTRN